MTPRWLLSISVLVLVGLPAVARPQQNLPETGVATSVSVRRGIIEQVALAAHPEKGFFLAVYEARGRIWATVLKPTPEDGVYRGKRARRISRVRRPNRRPSAIWDTANNEWLVAWDTGPEDLFQLAADLGAGGEVPRDTEIRVQRLRQHSARPKGDEQVIAEADRLLLGAQLHTTPPQAGGRLAGAIGLLNTAVEPESGGDSLLRLQRWSLEDGTQTAGIFAGIGFGRVGSPLPTAPDAETFVFPLEVIDGQGVSTAHVLLYDSETVDYGDTTPAMSPGIDSRRPGLARIGPSLAPDGLRSVWTEGVNCYFQRLDPSLTASGSVTRVADRCMLGRRIPGAQSDTFPGWVLGWSEGFATAPSPAATGARLITIDAEGNRTEGPTLMSTTSGPLADTFVVDPDSGRVWILWAESRNAKRSNLWLEVVDPL